MIGGGGLREANKPLGNNEIHLNRCGLKQSHGEPAGDNSLHSRKLLPSTPNQRHTLRPINTARTVAKMPGVMDISLNRSKGSGYQVARPEQNPTTKSERHHTKLVYHHTKLVY